VNKDNLPEKAEEVYALLKDHFKTFYDTKGSIGKMYRRVDEIGTPVMITIDYDSLKKNDVTVRDRDTMQQVRVKIKNLVDHLRKLL